LHSAIYEFESREVLTRSAEQLRIIHFVELILVYCGVPNLKHLHFDREVAFKIDALIASDEKSKIVFVFVKGFNALRVLICMLEEVWNPIHCAIDLFLWIMGESTGNQ